jgi:hypothetical protein
MLPLLIRFLDQFSPHPMKMNCKTYQVTLFQLHEFGTAHAFVHVIVVGKDTFAV